MNEKTNRDFIIVCIIAVLLICGAAVVAYFIGRADTTANGRTGSELETASGINNEIADEQQRAVELNRRAVEFAERVRDITEEANSSYGELGELNRGSSDISAAIRAEAKLLADYLRSISDIVNNYFDNPRDE